MNQGFDEGYEVTGHYNYKVYPEQDITDPEEYSADQITKKTIDFMKRQVENATPFFAYVPYYLVHKPLQPKKVHLRHFKEELKNVDGLGDDEIKVLAMIKSLDDCVGQLIHSIEEMGIAENTIIVFTSDNGHYKTNGNLFNMPYNGYKGQTLEGGIRVPYIFKWPARIKESSVSNVPIIHVDLYPTFLGLTGIKPKERYVLDGEDISPILLGEKKDTDRDALVWEYTNYARYNERTNRFASSWVNVIQMDGFKMTEDVENQSYRLFNLNLDPYENNEVSKKYPKVVNKLRERLELWKEQVGYEKPILNSNYNPN
ncbi:sulfatase-like hydrolase/transferase [Galbibacter sp. BG1]|uniref:sulfatase-like hydrolase/transferase n=1 Tax=Galbibacter sp. BG1 TaxID=1170699 RepID=UPI0015BA7086|nr:sulfatase-like hydrolase/transferase [Galbibacter sp. BG1]QLE02417.1 sulfatase-like hydrolase/transferase [Galbibacter sp. BG1]